MNAKKWPVFFSIIFAAKQMQMVVFPNIKINLGLTILEKRTDGYHNLQSIFYPVQWCDALELVESPAFHFENSGIEIPGNPADNLVVKAYELLKTAFDLPPVSIYLHKAIPTGAGLGAGSSDASFTLKALNDLFHLNLSEDQLRVYAAQLGSDCPFFILNTPCLVTGRGEILEKTPFNLSGFWIKIAHTGLQISTKEAFAGITPNKNVPSLESAPSTNPADFKNCFKNDFEQNCMLTYPVLAELKNTLYKEGAFYASMSGSGSAFFGLFEKEPARTGIAQHEFITQIP